MQLHQPDPEFISSPRAQRSFKLALKLASAFVALLWLVFTVDWLFGLDLVRYGLMPRRLDGLIGVLTTPLLHGSWAHLGSNTLPLLVGATAILFLYPNSSLYVVPILYGGAPLLAWTFARPDLHVGASGLIYGLLAYVFWGGLLRRDVRSIGVSLLIYFLYGSTVYGILPGQGRTSWELHLSGAILGLAAAWFFRRWDQTPRKQYDWDGPDGHEDELEYWLQKAENDRPEAPNREYPQETIASTTKPKDEGKP
ncbi:MAG: rhomboid family intramembrane serine protease [Wenzhouxiangellaceae bacterium]